MSILDDLERIVQSTRWYGQGSGTFNLVERASNTKLPKVTIKGVDRDVLVIHNKDSGRLCKDLSDCDGIQRRCDYVVACFDDGDLHLIFVELKSDSPDLAHITTQFRGTECFLDYCEAVLRRFYGTGIPAACRRHYVVFRRSIPLNKSLTQFPPQRPPSSPEEPEQHFYETPIRLRQLVATP